MDMNRIREIKVAHHRNRYIHLSNLNQEVPPAFYQCGDALLMLCNTPTTTNHKLQFAINLTLLIRPVTHKSQERVVQTYHFHNTCGADNVSLENCAIHARGQAFKSAPPAPTRAHPSNRRRACQKAQSTDFVKSYVVLNQQRCENWEIHAVISF